LMVLMQIVIGGVTRLTGSGLSITRWEIVTGTLPPLGAAAWEEAFNLYKASPQYQIINVGMTMDEFKFIYFWEYFHRLWARLMGLVFLFPFLWFLWRGMLSRRLVPRLLIVVALAGLEGFFGWAMVASGLRDRPWVNAYNLTLHLTMGLIIFSYLLWTLFVAYQPHPSAMSTRSMRRWGWVLVGVAFVQIALGAMMSGTKAGLLYPTWPDMNGDYFPTIIADANQWTAYSFTHYDTDAFVPTLIQFLHRNVAYLLSGLIIYFAWATRGVRQGLFRYGKMALLAMLGIQVLLGIITLLNCQGHIPVVLGVLHQAGAVALLGVLLFVNYQINRKE
jgi:heme a synthase